MAAEIYLGFSFSEPVGEELVNRIGDLLWRVTLVIPLISLNARGVLRVLDQAINARAVLHFKASIEVHSSTIDAPLKAAQHEILRRVVLLHPRFQIGGQFFATH